MVERRRCGGVQTASFSLTVDVPVGATADVHVPAEREQDVEASPGGHVSTRRMELGYLVHTVGSGTWRFVSRSKPTM